MTEPGPPPSGPAGMSPPALSADELVRLTGGRLLHDAGRPIRGGAVDSRLVRPGEVFVALPGERTDGHDHLAEAIGRGAAALIVRRPPSDLAALEDVTVVQVADGVAALGAIAAGWRRRFSPRVVGVTGSIAKTSTKEAVASVLGRRYRTLRSEANQNNEIGLPLTLLRLGVEHQAVVLEMGMYVGGEIADLAAIAQPSIGVVTAVQAVHLSRIGTLDAVERAKAELVEALPTGGTAILNADDERVARMRTRTAARILGYGFAEEADVTAERVTSAGLAGMRFVLRLPGRRHEAAVPGLGRLAVHNGLAAAAVGLAADVPDAAILAGLAAGWSAPHRGEVHRVAGVTIVDDAYNASPGSMVAALELLAGLPGRRIAVLGEMLELGDAAEAGHRTVGVAAAGVVDLLVVVGAEARAIAEGARSAGLDAGRVISVPDREAALDTLQARLRPADVVLIKASRGAALEWIVAGLVAGMGGSSPGTSGSP